MNEETQPIECRAAVDLPLTATNEILFLPIGLHAITPVSGGIGRPIKVKIGPESAEAIEAQHKALRAKGKRPYFDFNHEDGPASFWPESFAWRGGEGVIAKGEWTRRGKDAVEGKDFRAFSPVFHVDNKRAEAAQVVCKENAEPNMGGLVNNPAFKDLPLWAKNAESLGNAGATGENAAKEKTQMENEELAALRAKNEELTKEVTALKAAAETDDETAKSRLSTAEAELRAVHAEIEVEELRAKNIAQEEQIKARNKSVAEASVKDAIKRGAILPKDIKTQTALIARATADPSFNEIIKAMQGGATSLSTRIAGGYGAVTVTDEAPVQIFEAMTKLVSLSKRAGTHLERSQLAKELGGIYSREMSLSAIAAGSANAQRILAMPLSELRNAIHASGSFTDPDMDLGTLNGTLVTQRTLELLKFTFPALSMFTTDFSDQAVRFNQEIITRTIDIPSVVTYSRTGGWPDSERGSSDVPVTIDQHVGVNITFDEELLASTVRRLFDEQAPAAAYALAKYVMDDLYANITDANFSANEVIATSAFDRAGVVQLGTDLTLAGVPIGLGMRTLLLYPTLFAKLVTDTTLVTFAAFQKPELVTAPQSGASMVIPVDTFNVVNAPNLPTNDSNLTGFGGSKSALIVASRVPNDYTAWAPGVSNGNVSVVTSPDIGISTMLVQYVDHQMGTGTQRIALMFGTAPGQTEAGVLLKAAAASGSSRTS